MISKKVIWDNAGNIKPGMCVAIIDSIKKAHPGQFNNIPTSLIMGFIATESSFRTNVVSSADAIGLMQVKQSTYDWIKGVYPSFLWQQNGLTNPIENILAGMAFLKWIGKTSNASFFGKIQSYNTGVAGYASGSRAKDYAMKVLTNSFTFII